MCWKLIHRPQIISPMKFTNFLSDDPPFSSFSTSTESIILVYYYYSLMWDCLSNLKPEILCMLSWVCPVWAGAGRALVRAWPGCLLALVALMCRSWTNLVGNERIKHMSLGTLRHCCVNWKKWEKSHIAKGCPVLWTADRVALPLAFTRAPPLSGRPGLGFGDALFFGSQKLIILFN
jgi:hypothetical protein